ncbi:ABC transporter ATP-binding protein [Paludibacterium purpuratum]|uniref:Sorbitol ABC transporter ATP-binding protein /mannitol ABC transporter ATP-binding protein n=1 Tax=Paludibacterium purpuratum TaxID=1144873 RepID=A0A4R7B150_9NEIS|nr:sn-glycerol-3-phosphate ABC transporter ATP-binding protein UgpC [Paludibacterium purpuratum]TDR73046.1 sorbitol ABC transporter ATP-binding protein /mannitol ABC transporter ATP-binding protein [Paludibacterium purpuratum]
MAAVSLKGICKDFGTVRTLHGIDLEIRDGEFIVFVGPSGCGKSTLLRSIAGLEEISEGELQIDLQRVNELPPVKRGISMVFQSYALYPHMSVFENLAFGLRLAHKSKAEYTPQVEQVARVLQIDHLLTRKPKELSGGQRQRVAIGRAIVQRPKVFLFDEPLSNLDASLRVQMRIEIAKLHRELATTMIYVTHDQVEAMTLADRIVVLRAGRIEQVGSPTELYHRPANRFVAGFMGSPSMNFLPGRIAQIDENGIVVALSGGARVSVQVAPGRALPGDEVCVGVRPEHLHLAAGDNELAGEAMAIEQLGDSTVLYLQSAAAAEPLAARLPPLLPLSHGDACTLSFAPHHAHLFDVTGKAFERMSPIPAATTGESYSL